MRLLLVLLLCSSLGCSMAITSQGAFMNFGQSTISTCEVEDSVGDCTTVQGASLSEQGSGALSGIIGTALGILGLSYGGAAVP